MFDHSLTCRSPVYLASLLVLAPLIGWLSFRSLAGLGNVRRLLAILLRTTIVVLFVAALAEVQLVQRSDRLTVMYLVDRSLSISDQQVDTMVKYVNAAIDKRFQTSRTDFAGAIVFGGEAALELPPWDDRQQIERIETVVDREHSNLADAMKLAQASFRHDTAKRVVLITDGNENLGDAARQAQSLVQAGVSIDVVPVRVRARGEVAVERIGIPADVRRGQPFDLRVVLNNTTPPDQASGPIPGRLEIVRRAGGREEELLKPPQNTIALPLGKTVFTLREQIDQPDFYSYEARFVPDRADDDAIPQNNRATTFTHIRGKGQVLLLEDYEHKGELDVLAERLRQMNIEVLVQDTRPEQLFTDLGQLQPFDAVVLGNVPREHFSDEQIAMLVRNTQNTGSGLVMLGGPNSLGAGGWTNTLLEEAMPVDFQIKNAKVVPVGALAMLMHASEMSQGNHWQKVIAKEALKTLGNLDYCGVLYWAGSDTWLWRNGMIEVGKNRGMMRAAISQMTPSDMPSFDPGLKLAYQGFLKLQNAVGARHMIIISDGDPTFTDQATLSKLKAMGVTVSTIAVGTHGAAGSFGSALQTIANASGGKYYVVNNASSLPRIYQAEARKVARPLIFENKEGVSPKVVLDHEMVRGLEPTLPPVTGFVLTTLKPNPLVEAPIRSPLPVGSDNNTILAGWTYGLGKTAVLTTDAGRRWATAWTEWSGYDKLFSQIVNWTLREVNEGGKFSVASEVVDGQVRVVVSALDQDDSFLNFLNMGAAILGPDMKPREMAIKQVAPGRYVGEFDALEKGNYFLAISPGPGRAPLRLGVNIPYSDEFRNRDTNEVLLQNLSRLAPPGGRHGKWIEPSPTALTEAETIAELLSTDTFRHDLPKASSNQDVWHLAVWLGSCLFFGDVFVRRVSINFDWLASGLARLRDRLLQRETRPSPAETIERLRSRKAAVAEQIEQRRAAVKFEPSPEAQASPLPLAQALGETPPPARPPQAEPGPPAAEEEDFTSRLLKAKQQARKERETRPGAAPQSPPEGE